MENQGTDNNICVICQDSMDNSECTYMPCTHKYHNACVTEHAKSRVQRKLPIDCPTCRCCHYTENDKYYKSILEIIEASNDSIGTIVSPSPLTSARTLERSHVAITVGGSGGSRTPRYALNVVVPLSQHHTDINNMRDMSDKGIDTLNKNKASTSDNFFVRNKVALLFVMVILMLLITMLIVFL
jgi:hypothetical protein